MAKPSVIGSTINLLVSPAEFFESQQSSPPSRIPFLLVCLVCLLFLANTEMVHHDLFGLIDRSVALNPYLFQSNRLVVENGLSSMRPFTGVAMGFSALAWFPYWLLTAILLANIAVLFGYDYRLKELLRFTGFCFAAFLPSLLLSTALLLLHPATVPTNALIVSRDVGEVQSAFVSITKGFAGSFPFTAVRNLTLAAVTWYEILVLFAFRTMYRTKWTPSVVAVGVAAAILNGAAWVAQKAMGA